MRLSRFLVPTSMGLAFFAAGWASGCAADQTDGVGGPTDPSPGGPGTTAGKDSGGAPGTNECPACVTDKDCGAGQSCAQFGADIYCAPTCGNGGSCATGRVCSTVSSYSGAQVDVCIPQGDVCGVPIGPGTNPGTPGVDGGSSPPPPPPPPPPSNTCGTLVGPSVSASCNSCGSHTCQANGCYGGWWCDTSTKKCQAAPSNCGTPPAVDAGSPPPPPPPPAGDAGPGTIGGNGGTEASLYFSIVGDTRPANEDDTAGYPTAIITKIYQDIEGMSPRPPFNISTGDYQFSNPSGTQSGTQMDLYLGARNLYSGVWFPAMGNHECTGATASNCGSGNTNGITTNYTNFMTKFLGTIGQTSPYYEIDVNGSDGSWTAKFLFVAANAWDSAQSTWLDTAMSKTTTYTFVVRHESSSAASPGTSASESIMARHPYTLAIVGHSHTYSHSSTKEIIVGNGGAPITGSATYGFGLITQRADQALLVDVYNYQTMQADSSFHFVIKPDGTLTQ